MALEPPTNVAAVAAENEGGTEEKAVKPITPIHHKRIKMKVAKILLDNNNQTNEALKHIYTLL